MQCSLDEWIAVVLGQDRCIGDVGRAAGFAIVGSDLNDLLGRPRLIVCADVYQTENARPIS
jgi:hypothetical protein